jgi:prepilin-type processing-associated H-X9-DG protein
MDCFLILTIVGVLAFLMMSASASPRELARRSLCMKNLREIGLALRLYAEDHRGRFPCDPAGTTLGSFTLLATAPTTNASVAHHPSLYPAFVCPDDELGFFSRVTTGSAKRPLTAKNFSYAYGGFELSEFVAGDSPLACDRSSTAQWESRQPWSGNHWTHGSSGGNVLFADGRVSFVRTSVPGLRAMKNP